jgi:hypothetical protein
MTKRTMVTCDIVGTFCLARVLTRYFTLRWYFFKITAKLLGSVMGWES